MLLMVAAGVTLAARPAGAQTAAVHSEMPVADPAEVGMSADKLALVVPKLQEFVDAKKVAGATVIVARRGHIVLHDSVGWRDIERDLPLEKDSIVRIYSMTKAITSVAIMMLIEEEQVELDAPVSCYLPELADCQVFSGMQDGEMQRVAPERQMTVRDLLRHTSGLTYGFFGDTPVDQAYVAAGVLKRDDTLDDLATKLSRLPLLHQPGVKFNYSVSTDVLGCIIERVSGHSLADFFQQRVFDPLDMQDTAFVVAPEDVGRFSDNHSPRAIGGLRVIDESHESDFLSQPGHYSGGGGLTSTARDYMRFCQMLLNQGELAGARLLESDSVLEMTKNQVPDSAYPIGVGDTRPGVGFGLGFSVVCEITDWTQFCHVGEYGWGGAASTHFWISPDDELAVVVLSQRMPFTFQLETAVKPLIYAAIED